MVAVLRSANSKSVFIGLRLIICPPFHFRMPLCKHPRRRLLPRPSTGRTPVRGRVSGTVRHSDGESGTAGRWFDRACPRWLLLGCETDRNATGIWFPVASLLRSSGEHRRRELRREALRRRSDRSLPFHSE